MRRWLRLFLGVVAIICVLETFYPSAITLRRTNTSLHQNFKKLYYQSSGVGVQSKNETGKCDCYLDNHNASMETQDRSEMESSIHENETGFFRPHPWQMFQAYLTLDQLYSQNAPYMEDLLHSLATNEIKSVQLFVYHSQLKLNISLEDGSFAIAKPMRSPRDYVFTYDEVVPFWLDLERHTAEIASFHLDQILNFRRCPPCTGRVLNVTRDIQMKSTDTALLNSFKIKGNNTCFVGKCSDEICHEDNLVCAKGDLLEVAMCLFLPHPRHKYPIDRKVYPWRVSRNHNAKWQRHNICEDLKKDPDITDTRLLLDFVEQGIFDFLTLNYDRHSYYLLKDFGTRGFVVIIDNGKGFGNPYKDDITLLTPVYQCCIIRNSTYQLLEQIHLSSDNRLSDRMRRSLLRDPISRNSPILPETHLDALDRRLEKIVEAVDECIQRYGRKQVLIDTRTLLQHL